MSGKGGAYFYFTSDNKFVLKSISHDELEVFLKMIKDYTHRLSSSTPSLLTKVYGIFKISISKSSSTVLLLMENLSIGLDSPLVFDLKGSTHQRTSTSLAYADFKSMPRGQIYKDLDFFRLGKSIDIPEIFITSLELDSELLEKYSLMDYSLLLIISTIDDKNKGISKYKNEFKFEEFSVRLGIIDYLQCYTPKKKFEKTINSLRPDDINSFSCIPPDLYRKRFLDMIRDVFSK